MKISGLSGSIMGDIQQVGVGLGVDVISDLSINQVQRDAATASLFKIAWIEGNANRSFLGFGIL